MWIRKAFQIKRTAILEMRRLMMWEKVSVPDDLDGLFGIRDEVCNLSQGWIVEYV